MERSIEQDLPGRSIELHTQMHEKNVVIPPPQSVLFSSSCSNCIRSKLSPLQDLAEMIKMELLRLLRSREKATIMPLVSG